MRNNLLSSCHQDIFRTLIFGTLLSTIFSFTGNAQSHGSNGKWRVLSSASGYNISFNSDSTEILKIQANGNSAKTRIQRSYRIQDDGMQNIAFRSVNSLKQGDTCIFYTLTYQSNKVILASSKTFTSSNAAAVKGEMSRYHYLPIGADSLVVGLILNGTPTIADVQCEVDFVHGDKFQDYKTRLNRFAHKPANIEQLSTLCKVWGMLKYFTPEVLNKGLNWDEILLNSLAESFKNFDQDLNADKQIALLLNHVNAKTSEKNNLNAALSARINKLPISSKNKRDLIKVFTSAALGHSAYFTPPTENSQTSFSEENIDKQVLPDARARLLALFRYWNIINYFNPYKADLLQNWESQLKTFIPAFICFDDLASYNRSLLLLNASIGDGHTAIPLGTPLDLYETIYPGKPISIIPATYTLNDQGKVFVNQIDSSFSAPSGLKTGDELISINGIRMDTLAAGLKLYISDPSTRMKNFYLQSSNWLSILPADPAALKFVYKRDGQVTMKQMAWSIPASLKSIKYLNEHTGLAGKERNNQVLTYFKNTNTLYINPFKWNPDLQDSAITALNASDQLIVDCRSYPSWDFLKFAERLIQDDRALVRFTYATAIPGQFESTLQRSTKDGHYFNKRIYVLISEESKSRSEFLAKILKSGAKQCLLVGRRTAGADGDVSYIPMIGRNYLAFRFSDIAVEFADGVKTQQVGIKPDFTVKDDLVKAGDPILNYVLDSLTLKEHENKQF